MADTLARAQIIEGTLDATGLRFAIVVSRFNNFITDRLLDGAMDTLVRSGARAEDVVVVRVPGAFEIPSAVTQVLGSRSVDAVITLGCLIKGDTIHFDLIAAEVTRAIGQLSLAFEVPIAFGVLTTDTLEQAIHRAGAKAGNKGGEAALAAIEQVRLFRALAATAEATGEAGEADAGG
jgi:6,7-dimethyl-8-ribityllumazine synthase